LTGATGPTGATGGLGYTIQVDGVLALPGDATTYYFGCMTASTTGGNARCYIPKVATVKAVYGTFVNTGGSAETSTLSFRLNNATDTTITAAATNGSTVTTFSNSGLSISVTAGDYFEIKWVTPTWATNPPSLQLSAIVYLE
jgi:hypothetical protein